MRIPKTLSWKLTLAFMLVAFTTTALVAVFIRVTSADRLTQLIIDQQRSALEQSLSSFYATNGSWSGVENDWQQLQPQVLIANPAANPGNPPPNGHPPEGGQGRGNFMGLANAQGVVIVSADPKYPAGSTVPTDVIKAGTAVTVNGQRVGTILMPRQPPGFNSQESQFLQRTTQALLYAILGALLVALAMGIVLSRTLTHPLQALTRAARNITQGQLEQQVTVKSSDEIGQLATAFNSMSQEVARVNQQRKQMTADIAHDLRTPLTVISGYVEAMRDGVLRPSPERLDLIYSEIERLQSLVGDLRLLSLADAGELPLNPQPISPRVVLERAEALYCHQAEQIGVTIHVDAAPELPDIRVDEARMMQVLDNLISNALRYTPAGGSLTLSASAAEKQVEICVSDTGTGIPPEEVPYIFDRFHRADKSRHTESGESGLGLAIVKALVEMHRGKVSAESGPGGTKVRLLFPAVEQQ